MDLERSEGSGLDCDGDTLSRELLRPHIRFLSFPALGKTVQTFKSWGQGMEGEAEASRGEKGQRQAGMPERGGSAEVAEFAGNDSVKNRDF